MIDLPTMVKNSASFTLIGEDVKLLNKIRKSLHQKMGDLPNAIIVRMALRMLNESLERNDDGKQNLAS